MKIKRLTFAAFLVLRRYVERTVFRDCDFVDCTAQIAGLRECCARKRRQAQAFAGRKTQRTDYDGHERSSHKQWIRHSREHLHS